MKLRLRPFAGVWFLLGLFLVATRNGAAPVAGSAPYPLDPLTADEISQTVQLLKDNRKLDGDSRFGIIQLHEPPKAQVLSYRPGSAIPREALAVVYQQTANKTYEAVLDLTNRKLTSWKNIPGAQPAMLGEDAAIADQVVRSDPRWQEAMRKRGITDFRNVQVALWTAGYFGIADEEGYRLGRAMSYYRGQAQNFYARPIEGVIAWVNLNQGKVAKFVDTGIVPVPREVGEVDPRSVGKQRPALHPLEITQSAGPEFDLQGNEVQWQNWSFRFGVDPREGLVIHQVQYTDAGRKRPVMYRASISEMVVPYADPSPGWFFRSPFDAGELGLGSNLAPMRAGSDCPENTVFRNAVIADEYGNPREIPRAIGIYERDGGLLWRWRGESRRSRQLVIAMTSHLGNYDYRFNWVFQQDGSIAAEVLLTGIMTAKAVPPAEMHHDVYGHPVAPGLTAVHHQHFFNFRLDMDVDGDAGNCVTETNTESVPKGPANKYGTAFVMKDTALRNERDAQRQVSLASSRRWTVTNCTQKNALGSPTGYSLMPGENAVSYASPDSILRARAGFLNAHLFVTPYQPAERYAAGDYPNQSHGGDGLPRWTHANRSIQDRDVVLWYTVGVTHIPRPEEWPVMPVHQAGFRLVPNGFFSRNPALDVPRQ